VIGPMRNVPPGIRIMPLRASLGWFCGQQRTSTPTWLRCLLCRRSVCVGQPITDYIQLLAAAATE